MLKDKITSGFEIAEHLSAPHELVKDLRPYKAATFYIEFTLTILCVWGIWLISTFIIPKWLPANWPWYYVMLIQVVAVSFSGMALHRAALYIHEVSHMKVQRVKGFETFWNLTIGFPLGFPSYAGRAHLVHHDPQSFGGDKDPEYMKQGSFFVGSLPNVFEWILDLVGCSLERGFMLLMVIFRGAILVPISAVVPSFRRKMEKKLHYLAVTKVDESFIDPTKTKSYLLMDLGCMLFAWGWIALAVLQIIPWQGFALLSVVFGWQACLDKIRVSYFAHHYRHPKSPAGFPVQLVDSINYTSNPIMSRLIGPVGLRYHALHHLFPYLPYHALNEAHKRLVNREDEIGQAYRRTLV